MPFYTTAEMVADAKARLCTTCRHHKLRGSSYHECTRTGTTSIIDGTVEHEGCNVARFWPTLVAALNGSCGKGGRFWEPVVQPPRGPMANY
jgi:hypothetical protein